MADDVATLGFEVDSKSLRTAADDLRMFQAVAARTGESVEQVKKRFTELDATRRQSTKATEDAHKVQERGIDLNRRSAEQMLVLRNVFRELGSQASSMAGSLGRVGSVLLAMGPGGLVVGAILGALALGFKQAADAALALAEHAGQLKDFAETTGFTVVQLQALEKAGAQVGVSSGQVQTSIERFAFQFNSLKEATGDLYDKLRQIDPALAIQASRAGSLAEAWDVVAVAMKRVDAEERVALARTAFGRGGVGTSRLAIASTDAGGVRGLVNAMRDVDKITAEQADRWDSLGDKINENMKQAKQNIVALYADEVLTGLEALTQKFLEMSRAAKENEKASKQVFDAIVDGALRAIPAVGPVKKLLEDLQKAKQAGEFPGYTEPTGPHQMYGPEQPTAEQNKAAALKALGEEAIRAYERYKKYIEVLGEAATPTEKLTLKFKEMAAVQAKEKDEQLRGAAARSASTAQLAANVSQLERSAAAVGSLITPTEQLRLKEAQLDQQRAKGEISDEDAARGKRAAAMDQEISLLQETVTALGDSATAAQKYALAIAQLQQKLKAERISQEEFNTAVRNADPYFKLAKDSAEQFTSSLVQGLMQGQNLAEALRSSMRNLAQSLAQGAIKDLFNGDYVMAAVKGVAAITAAILGTDKKAKAAADSLAAATKIKDAQARSSGFLSQRVNLTGTDDLAAQLNAFDLDVEVRRHQEALAGGGAMGELEKLIAAERLEIIKDFADRAVKAEQEIAARRLSFQDRLFAAVTDTSTLEGALAAFDREAQRQRIEEQRAGGQTMADLEAALSAERLNVQKKFNDDAIDAQKRAQQEQLNAMNAAARNIVNYVQGLLSGPDSQLSPSSRLFNAQAAYATKLSLAQGGNTDALGSITQDADTLLKAAKDFYGSASGFQAIFQQVANQLLALPAVQTSTDPVVVAMRDVEQAILDQTVKVDAGNTIAGQQSAILTTIQNLTNSTQANTASQVSLQTTQNNLVNTANVLIGTTNTFLNSISALQTTANSIMQAQYTSLEFIHTGTDRLGDINTHADAIHHNTKFFWDTDGNTFVQNPQSHRRGGWVFGPGTGTSDSIPTYLSNREFIVNAASAQSNAALLETINRGSGAIALPSMSVAANDNGGVVSELRALRTQNERMEQMLAASLARIAELEGRNVEATDRNTAHREDRGERDVQARRMNARRVMR